MAVTWVEERNSESALGDKGVGGGAQRSVVRVNEPLINCYGLVLQIFSIKFCFREELEEREAMLQGDIYCYVPYCM
jgi:hypothetical protein